MDTTCTSEKRRKGSLCLVWAVEDAQWSKEWDDYALAVRLAQFTQSGCLQCCSFRSLKACNCLQRLQQHWLRGGTLHAGTPNQHSDNVISLSIRPNRCLLRQAPTCDPQRLLPCCCQIPRVAQPRLVSPTADQITRQLLGVTNIWMKFNQNRYKYGTNGLLSWQMIPYVPNIYLLHV